MVDAVTTLLRSLRDLFSTHTIRLLGQRGGEEAEENRRTTTRSSLAESKEVALGIAKGCKVESSKLSAITAASHAAMSLSCMGNHGG
ncbi:hypothetical protein BHM03_00037905 [Ensete ventricosum]|nr:hypothetical protein BHM03_00037905 [Ensete ventricosum]